MVSTVDTSRPDPRKDEAMRNLMMRLSGLAMSVAFLIMVCAPRARF
jgi:hypothetical protein